VNGVNTGVNTAVQNERTIVSSNRQNLTTSQGNSLPCHPSYHVPTSNIYDTLASQDSSEYYAVDNQNISNDPKLCVDKSMPRNHSEMGRKVRSDCQQYPARLKSTVPNLNEVKKHKVIKRDIDMNSIHLIPGAGEL
jgi:hypothetical protein